MDIDKDLADPKLEREGVWLPYRAGSRVRIARAGNAAFRAMQDQLMAPYTRLGRDDSIDSSTQLDILCRCVAKTILLDWEGFTSGGKPLPHSEAKALELMTRSMDFRNDIALMSASEENFRAKQIEEAVGNSEPS